MTRRTRPATRFRSPGRKQLRFTSPAHLPGDVVMQGMDFYRVTADGKYVLVDAKADGGARLRAVR